jgi:hypothetical protein
MFLKVEDERKKREGKDNEGEYARGKVEVVVDDGGSGESWVRRKKRSASKRSAGSVSGKPTSQDENLFESSISTTMGHAEYPVIILVVLVASLQGQSNNDLAWVLWAQLGRVVG